MNGQRPIRRELDSAYVAETDLVDEKTWYELLGQFEDANIYQTWSYGLARSGPNNISHLLVKAQGRVVAMAQCRIERVPIIGAGIAYVMWGPLWKRRDRSPDPAIFRQALRALRNEYAGKRGLLLRLYPVLFEKESSQVESILEQEGFLGVKGQQPARTILMDVTPSLEDLRNGLKPHWQRELKAAEKQQAEILEGVDDELFQMFIGIYKEMVARKQFREPNDIQEFREIQRRLPAEFKMKILLCRSSQGLCAGMITSAIGGTAVYLFGATSTTGMKSRGSYLLQWKFIERLKALNVPRYDLNGINPEANPGTYKFKSDLAGERGREVRFLGRFECCESAISSTCVSMGEWLRAIRRSLVKT